MFLLLAPANASSFFTWNVGKRNNLTFSRKLKLNEITWILEFQEKILTIRLMLSRLPQKEKLMRGGAQEDGSLKKKPNAKLQTTWGGRCVRMET